MSTPAAAPRLSVIVPAYQAAGSVARCLQALLAQCRPGVEVILADDGSTDGTAALVARRFPGVRLLRLPHAGSAAARAAAIGVARAPRLAFLDADCVPCAGWMQAVLAHADRPAVYMGRVVPPADWRSRAVALLQFGPYLGSAPRALDSFALLNLSGPAALFRRHPIPLVRHGHDRIWSWRLAASGVPIRFEPAQAVVHAPVLTPAALLARQVSYARRFLALRRLEPGLPGARLAMLPGAGTGLLTVGRLARDLVRLCRLRAELGIRWYGLPGYALVLAAARWLEAVVQLGAVLEQPLLAPRLRPAPQPAAPGAGTSGRGSRRRSR
ncbi:MAG: hypothetical protein KatS3mg102_1549 [Planctomycetota bacterium]|nr:MAG: hypothetical protein KatS3mg102_1549 [Planctomycetota bacterium]